MTKSDIFITTPVRVSLAASICQNGLVENIKLIQNWRWQKFIVFMMISILAINAWAEVDKIGDETEEIDEIPTIEYIGRSRRDPLKSPIKIKDLDNPQPSPETIVLPKLQLQGLLSGAQTPAAIINNQIIRVGNLIMEAEIIEITNNGVKLLYKGKEFFIEKEHL
ncbi:MAG: hypothetical protein ABH952_05930 [Candidatus Omnitrophota bacterium]